jgi:outer membrane protein assembly factor BamB
MRIKNFLSQNWLLSLIVLAGLAYGAYRVATERVMTLWAFDARTGAAAWSAEFDGEWRGVDRLQLTPDGVALVLPQTGANKLHRVDPSTGATVWTRDFAWDFTRDHTTPYVANDTIYIVSGDSGSSERVSAFELSTGAERWSAPAEVSDGAVAGPGGLWLSRSNGATEMLERFDSVSGVRSTLAVTPARNSELYCLLLPCIDREGAMVFIANSFGPGRVVWTDGSRAPLVFGDRVRGGSLGAEAVYVTEENGSRVSAYRLADGARLWSTGLEGAPREVDVRSVYITPNGLYAIFEFNRGGTNEAWLTALDPATGAERWRQAFGSAFGVNATPPAAALDTVAVLREEQLFVYRASDGVLAWQYPIGPSPDVVVFDPAANRLIAIGRGERWKRWAAALGIRL